MNREQEEEKRKKIIMANKQFIDRRLPENEPMISIIILNRNGAVHLKDFAANFVEHTSYKNYEIIFVDNGSTDESISILVNELKIADLQIIRNNENKSFSQACNQGAQYAQGEYLLLLNNDVEPTYGWLHEMIKCALKTPKVGAVGAKLIYPAEPVAPFNKTKALTVQHSGIHFKESGGFMWPYSMGKGVEPFADQVNEEGPRIAVSGAALLVKKDIYFEVDGLDEIYNYGYEDVDFCLKLHKRGYINMYCPTALLFHHEFGTQCKERYEKIKDRMKENQRKFHHKWNAYLKNEYLKNGSLRVVSHRINTL